MVILGVDPGYATTGFGLIRAERGTYALLRYGTVTTPAGLPFPQRLNILFEDMTQLLEVTKPEAVAVEELFWGHNITTGIGVATSMFTAIVGTRAIVNLLYGGKRINKLSI